MDLQDIKPSEADALGNPPTSTEEPAEDTRPTLTPEEFQELVGLNARRTELQATGFGLQEEFLAASAAAQQRAQQLEELRSTLRENAELFNARYAELVVAKVGSTEGLLVKIENTVPHYITLETPPTPPAA